MRDYFSGLVEVFGRGWNRFFYTPTDPFSVALLRVAVAVIALYWQLSYTPDLVRFFGAEGIFPWEAVEQMAGNDWSRWTLFALFEGDQGIWIAHAVSTLVLLALVVGFKTRVASLLALYVVLSYVHRAPIVTGLPERMLAFLLLYLCVAPAGAALSVDSFFARRRDAARRDDPAIGESAIGESVAANIALRLVQIHLVVVYAMMGLAKLGIGSETWWMGEAVWWLAVRPETRVVDLTGVLHDRPLLINAWTHAIVLFEIAFAILVWNRWARPLLLAISVPLYFALALISGQTLFCLLIVVAGIAFVPPAPLRTLLTRRNSSPLLGKPEVAR